MKKFLRELSNKKIKINWNKNPIKMELFLSFLTIETKTGSDHLGYERGWTRHYGENNLIVGGGIIRGIEYLDTLEYRQKLDNPYSNYVNPFYLFDIMTEEGKRFFLDYYRVEIQEELDDATRKLDHAKEYKNDLFNFWESIGFKRGEYEQN